MHNYTEQDITEILKVQVSFLRKYEHLIKELYKEVTEQKESVANILKVIRKQPEITNVEVQEELPDNVIKLSDRKKVK